MHSEEQGQLADLWAVGGEQSVLNEFKRYKGFFQYCPGCAWKLTGKFSTCPRCGEDLRMKICPYCRGVIPVCGENCPRCTADFLSYS